MIEVYIKYPKERMTTRKVKSIILGRLAQLVERYPYKVDVTSSSLVMPTIFDYLHESF